jgi:branched-chain amino acid transport system substrate-binding protein
MTVFGGATRLLPRGSVARRFESFGRLCAVIGMLASVAACQHAPPPPPPPPPPVVAPPPVVQAPPPPVRTDQPNYFRLRGTPRNTVPVRVALLLPLSSPQADTRQIAAALQHAAELALFDARNNTVILMPRDDGGSPERAAAAARDAIDDGAEVILGPLFAQAAAAVAPIARARNVPVISFSTDREVGGNGVYLLSFQPETEVNRIVSYAARRGHSAFAALVPQTAYGERVRDAFRDAVDRSGGRVTAVQGFPDRAEAVAAPSRQVMTGMPDAIMVGAGGTTLRAAGSSLAVAGMNPRAVKLLGTGLWNDPALQREPSLVGGWFAAPAPEGWNRFQARYRNAYGAAPPRLATLAYDGISLIALLAGGRPYQRYTRAALTDPNGFSGIDGIFRFRDDGSAERGLAVLQVNENGFGTVDAAPKTFQAGF